MMTKSTIRTNVPPSRVILMAMPMRLSNEHGIAQCSMYRATQEATGRRHQPTNHSLSPRQLPGLKAKQGWWKKYTYFDGHFDGHGNVPVRYHEHCLMEEVQGFTRSHWTLQWTLGNYSFRIAPAATRVAGKTMKMKNTPTLLAISMAMAMCRYNTVHIVWWRRSRTLLEATGRRHQAGICSDIINQTCIRRVFFYCQHIENGLEAKVWPLLLIGVWQIKLMRII